MVHEEGELTCFFLPTLLCLGSSVMVDVYTLVKVGLHQGPVKLILVITPFHISSVVSSGSRNADISLWCLGCGAR